MPPIIKRSRTYTDYGIIDDSDTDDSDTDSVDLPDPALWSWNRISPEEREQRIQKYREMELKKENTEKQRRNDDLKYKRKRLKEEKEKNVQKINKVAREQREGKIYQLKNIEDPGILIKTYWNEYILEKVLSNERKDRQFLNIIPLGMLKQIIEGGLLFTTDPRYEDDTDDFDKWKNIAGTNYIQNFMDFWRIFANHYQQLQKKKDIVPALYDYCYSHGAQIYFNRLLTVSPDTGNDKLRTKWYNHFQTFTDDYPVFSRNENSLYNHLKNVTLKHKSAPLYFFLFNLITFTSAPSTDKLFNPTHETNRLAASFL
jgi:hypothetical protein